MRLKRSKVADTGDGGVMEAFEEARMEGEENVNVPGNRLEGSVVSLEGVEENEKKPMKKKKKKEEVDRKSDTGGDDKGRRKDKNSGVVVGNGEEGSVLYLEERKEEKKKHKEKRKEGVERKSCLDEDGENCSKNGGDIARMDSEKERVEKSKKRKREKESDTDIKSKEVNLEEEKNADQMLEDNGMDELAEAQKGSEDGDIPKMSNDEEEKSNKKKKKKKRKRENVCGNVEEKIGTQNETCKESTDANEVNGADKGKKKAKSDKLSYKDDSDKDEKKAEVQISNGKSHKLKSRTKKDAGTANTVENPTPGGTSKSVGFSDHVEVFPLSGGPSKRSNVSEDGLVRGKRFTKEEDELVRVSVFSYIETHNLGNEGLEMVMNCKKHPEIKNCWKEIGASLPWRPFKSVYLRAHIVIRRIESHNWTKDEVEFVQDFVKKHGRDWKKLGEQLRRDGRQCRDTWRRIKLPNLSRGRWTQKEYQNLFDLVNIDLRMRAYEERKSKYGMLRDNVSWQAISDKLATRNVSDCCKKWYSQLSSPLVSKLLWADVDDYRMVDALSHLDAVCLEDVDWDNLLEHRPGDVCRKRWNQMIRHIGDFASKSFSKQVEVLEKRYAPDALEAREIFESKPIVP